MKRVSFVTILAVFLLSSALFAFGTNGTITGTITDIVSGSVIGGAKIVDQNGLTTYTGSNGAYTLSEPAGSYTLTTTASGHLITTQTVIVTAGVTSTVNWALTGSYTVQTVPSNNYVILAWNDLGMHCDQDDYSYFSVLPPFNTLHAQVFLQGGSSTLVNQHLIVKYSFPKKTNSTLHTNFWTYASQFGWNLAPNVGLTGNGLSGNMVLDSAGLSYVATGIPITPYDDDGTWDPYGTALITVQQDDGPGTGSTSVVAPVSTEMACANCHGTTSLDSGMTPQLSILTDHDKLNGTTFVNDYHNGKIHLCGSCHQDNALGTPGVSGVESLSLAMHNWHKDKMTFTSTAASLTPNCYNCHPGSKTQCMRGIMHRAGKVCADCHGDMYGMTTGLQNGRQAWLQEPKCGQCHASKYAENSNTLYRNSTIQNAPDGDMNQHIYCEACHNSTHGERTTSNSADYGITQQYQGDNYWVWNCNVCHKNAGYTVPQNMHH